MAIDFPVAVTDPSQPWTNPDTGVTYIYKDGAWRVISQSNIVDINDEFVNVDGDNMTGDLTLGTDKITLDATNGTAKFAGDSINLNADGSIQNTYYIQSFGDNDNFTTINLGVITCKTDGDEPPIKVINGDTNNPTAQLSKEGVFALGTDTGAGVTTNISLDGTGGSATFAGAVSSTYLSIFNGTNNPGEVAAFTGAQGGQGLRIGIDAFDGNDTEVTLQAGALNKGSKLAIVTSDRDGTVKKVDFGNSDGRLINGIANDISTFSISSSGSAVFAGNVDTAGAYFYGGTGYIADGDLGLIFEGVNDNTFGTVIGVDPNRDTNASVGRELVISLNESLAPARPVARFRSNGSLELGEDNKISFNAYTGNTRFDGQIEVGQPDYGAATAGVLIGTTPSVSSAGIAVFNQTTDPNFNSCFAAYGIGANNIVASISNEGEGYFKDYMTVGAKYGAQSLSLGASSASETNITSRNFSGAGAANTPIVFGGYDSGGAGYVEYARATPAGIVFHLEADNDANYTTATEEYTETESYTGPLGNTLEREVTRTRDVRTYTGPTLNIKTELQRKNTALAAIKTAAEDATITTLSDFKLAIAAALANI